MITAKAIWHQSKIDTIIIEEALKAKSADDIVIKSHYSLISAGTERLVANGRVPKSLYESMKVPGMGGNFNFPIKYGYSVVGEIISEGALKGKMVHLLHPHQDIILAKPVDISIIPNSIPAKRATLASNVETAINAIWDAQVSIGDKVLLCGFGLIGALIAQIIKRIPAIELYILEKNTYRKQLAQKMGFKIYDTQERKYDLSFHTSGSSSGLQTCIDAVGMEGKVIELSWYGTKTVNLQLGADFHQQRKQIISSQVAHIPFNKSARWNFKRRKKVVFDLLKNPTFDQLLDQEIKFEEGPTFYKKLRQYKILNKGLSWIIKYS